MTTITETSAPSFFDAARAALAAFAAEISARRARRAQSIALRSLLEMEPHRLSDLGIDLIDVREAIANPVESGRILSARRTERSVRG